MVVDEPKFPPRLAIGDFALDVETVMKPGVWNAAASQFEGVVATAWLRFDCGGSRVPPLWPDLRPGLPRLRHSLQVVKRVVRRQTEVSLAEAQRVQPDIQLGETLTVEVALRPSELQEIAARGLSVLDWLNAARRGDVLVQLEEATVRLDVAEPLVGLVVKGAARYPADRLFPTVIEHEIEGFTLVISSLQLTPRGMRGSVVVRLPPTIASPDSCRPATLDLGTVRLTPSCDLYVDGSAKSYGPWLLGDTGMLIQGTGYVLDLSTSTSAPGWPPGWRGLLLMGGEATGVALVPDPSNTGYLRGLYAYNDVVIVEDGFHGDLTLQGDVRFSALNPLGYDLTLHAGWLQVIASTISGGEFGPGEVALPPIAVCDSTPGTRVVVSIVALSVQPNLDLAGIVDYGGGPISWGELTHPGQELMAWTVLVEDGYAYFPAGAAASYCPESGGVFTGPAVSSVVDASLSALAANHVAGVTFARMLLAYVLSPDHPGGAGNPFKIPQLHGWLHVGGLGVDGELTTSAKLSSERIGEPARTSYVGVRPFDADLFVGDRRNRLAQFVTSAVFDSSFTGAFRIPVPCDIAALPFDHMQLTSTAHLVGGDVGLPPGGVPLAYWHLQLVPTGPPGQAGVVSARTGRIVFLAAGIAEPRHFAAPFGLTWGEVLATGNLGHLFLDNNNYAQRFDGIAFTPEAMLLSKYVAGTPDPFLATCGTVHFPFFGPSPVNIRDAYATNAAAPFLGRNVTVPKAAIAAGCDATDLTLRGVWKDIVSSDLALFECPDAQVDYNAGSQDGFLGIGTSEFGFLHSDGLDIDVEIHSGATDIRVSSTVTHDIDVGLFARLGGIGEVSGCARIEGPLLTRMSFHGSLEQSGAAGAILGPKVGYEVEIDINVTPTSLDFYAAGDMLMSVTGVDLELSAMVHLLCDFAMGSAEGELVGRIDCDAAITGLAGEGQVTWHIGPGMHYLQGRMRVAVVGWVGAGLEGGFFVGEQVPTPLVWVLQPTNPHFGVSPAVLPAVLTGVFGYGQVSFAVNWYVFGGGVDLYAGMGAFAFGPPGLAPVFPGIAALPYVVGACGIHVHGEILGGVVSASAWANLTLRGPLPVYFEGTFGLEGCVAWVLCASVDVTGGVNSGGFYLY